MQIYGIDFEYILNLFKVYKEKCLDISFCDKINDYIQDSYYSIKRYIRNFYIYQPIIRTDEWWDFYHFENLIIFKLKDIEKHWGKDTHYVGDCFAKKRIQVLLREWNKIQTYENEHPLSKEVDKMREEWFRKLGRLLPRLWD